MNSIHEPERQVPVARCTDVLVCGGGPAGVAAALHAARSGARTLLLERHPFLGGVWTAGALTIIIDGQGRGGLNAEIRDRLGERGATTGWRNSGWTVYGIEAMKLLLDEMIDESGVEVQLYTNVVAAAVENGRVKGVFTESKSGREFIEAQVVIDATGDGDVAALAGCAYEKGRPSDGKLQPMTLYGRIGGYRGGPASVQPMLDICRSAGWDPSYERVTLFPQPGQPGVFMLMATHLYGADATNARDLTTAEIQGRREIQRTVDVLRKHGGPDWRDIFLIDTGPFLGVREGRRIIGRHYLTEDEIVDGAQFDDGICTVRFNVDVHHLDPAEGKGLWTKKVKPYDIPYRALLARDVDNVMMAGRCISGDHIAHASYRVTGVAVATGEAVGQAAAMAVRRSVNPVEVDVRELDLVGAAV